MKYVKENGKNIWENRMNRIAEFEKVSYEQFAEDWNKAFENRTFSDKEIKKIYESIILPERKTMGSAGYDFISPLSFKLLPNTVINIPTGIRAKINDGWVLMIYMRSGLGFKHGLRLINSTGIIDSDYYDADNMGHIHIKLINDSSLKHTVEIGEGDGISQGVFIPYGLTKNDRSSGVRIGGFGSTDKENSIHD